MARIGALLCALSLVAACGDDDGEPTIDAAVPVIDAAVERPPAAQNFDRDILSTQLELNLDTTSGSALITLAADDSKAASFEIGDLTILSVKDAHGDLNYATDSGRLDVGIPDDGAPVELTVDYTFAFHANFDGYMGSNGLTFLWPYFCRNLYPCKSAPDDGLQFTLSVQGVPDGATAVYPQAITTDAPSYMIALAYGDYQYQQLGTTTAGTEVGVYYFAADETAALAGTAHLAEVFDWLEQTYGGYAYGDQVASVEARWPGGGYGGMEHHPYWHVARGSMSSEEVHAHEAAHGWFGNGIRIQCWEDFVLSEGVVSYLAARSLAAVGGPDLWPTYQSDLEAAIASGDTVAWPTGCNDIDILTDPLWSSVPYMKGAFFMKDVEAQVGTAQLDAVLADFYQTHRGSAASMQDLIDAIEAQTGEDIDPLVGKWLHSLGLPE